MKHILHVLIIIFFLFAAPVYSADFYIAQSASGSANGTSCSNARAIGGLTWGAGNQVAPGDTLHLCGTFTSRLAIGASGTLGNPITIKFEDGAKFSKEYWDTNGAITSQGYDYIVIDGGTNGTIECTNNGTAKTYQQETKGIIIGGSDSLTIKNISFLNLYVHTSGSALPSGENPRAIDALGGIGNNILIRNNTFTYAYWVIDMDASSGSPINNIVIDHNTFRYCQHSISMGFGKTVTNITISNNTFGDYYVWDGPGCPGHHNALHFFSNSSSGHIDNMFIYNNYGYGNVGNCDTSHFYMEAESTSAIYSNVYIYNNVLTSTSGSTFGLLAIGGVGTLYPFKVYNNTFICSSGMTGVFLSSTNNRAEFKNNIIIGCSNAYYGDYSKAAPTADYNMYANNGNISGGNLGSSTTIAQWRTLLGSPNELHSITTSSPGIGSDGVPTAASQVINNGVSLLSYFNTDKAGTTRPQGSAWDIGAFEYSGKFPLPPNYIQIQ